MRVDFEPVYQMLLHRAMRKVKQAAIPEPIYPPHMRWLHLLSSHPMTIFELAQASNIAYDTIRNRLYRAERQKLVQRQRRDGRTWEWKLRCMDERLQERL